MLGQEETDLSCPENRHNNEECKILSNIEQPILFNPGKESGGGGAGLGAISFQVVHQL